MSDKIKDQAQDAADKAKQASLDAEGQVNELISALEDQEAQVWAYLLGGVVALLVGLIAAYYYAQSVNARRKTRLERIRSTIREGLGL